MNNFPDEVLINILNHLSDEQLIKESYNRQSYHCSRYILRQRVFERGWLNPEIYTGEYSDAEWAAKGFKSWSNWCEKIAQIQKPYPHLLPEKQREKHFFKTDLLNDYDIDQMKALRSFSPDGSLDTNHLQHFLVYKFMGAETIEDQYRYISALMHFPLSQDLLDYWRNSIPLVSKRKLLLAEAGKMPPILFQALLHGNYDFFLLVIEHTDAQSWVADKKDILTFSLRAIGLLGFQNIAERYFEKLHEWNVYDDVMSVNNRHLFKTFRDAAKFGYPKMVFWLLQALPEKVTTRKGVYDYDVKMLSSGQDFVKELAARTTDRKIWEQLDKIIPKGDHESADDYYEWALKSALDSMNLNNIYILLELSDKRKSSKRFFKINYSDELSQCVCRNGYSPQKIRAK